MEIHSLQQSGLRTASLRGNCLRRGRGVGGGWARFAEGLESRVMLSGWGTQLLARVQASQNGVMAIGGSIYGASGPAVDKDGNVYVWEGNSIYEVPADGTGIRVAADLGTMADSGPSESWYPWGGLFLDGQGNLYGYRASVYPDSTGEVFELPRDSGTPQIVARFSSGAASNPFGVTVDKAGNIYGLETRGWVGNNLHGDIVEVAAGSDEITTLATIDDVSPEGMRLTVDGEGNVYGFGTSRVWEIKVGSGVAVDVATFGGSDFDGAYASNLVVDGAGNLYGTAFDAPGRKEGIFEIKAGSGQMTTLASGMGVEGEVLSMISDSSGDVYGATLRGEIFEVSENQPLTELTQFSPPLGGSVEGLALDASGGLYAVSQDFYMSLPWGPYYPPSVPTLFKIVPEGEEHLEVTAPAKVDSKDGLSVAVTVKMVGADGEVDTGSDAAVSLMIAFGPGGELGGTVEGKLVNGVATFDVTLPSWGTFESGPPWDLRIWPVGATYIFGANADGFATGYSNEIDVTPPDGTGLSPAPVLSDPISGPISSDPVAPVVPNPAPVAPAPVVVPVVAPVAKSLAAPVVERAAPTLTASGVRHAILFIAPHGVAGDARADSGEVAEHLLGETVVPAPGERFDRDSNAGASVLVGPDQPHFVRGYVLLEDGYDADPQQNVTDQKSGESAPVAEGDQDTTSTGSGDTSPVVMKGTAEKGEEASERKRNGDRPGQSVSARRVGSEQGRKVKAAAQRGGTAITKAGGVAWLAGLAMGWRWRRKREP